jgi:ACS family hexuronate transporter-like MFS transporter
VAPIIVTFITIRFGWRWAFIITGSLGFVWLLFWLYLYRIPLKHPKITQKELDYIISDNEEDHAKPLKIRELLRLRQTYGICLSRFVTEWVWWFFLFWTPDFLIKTQGVNIKEMVLPLIVIYTFASFGGIGGGWISGYFIKTGKSIDKARKTSVLLCAIAVLPLIFAPLVSNIWAAILLISLAAAAHQGWASNIFTITSDIFPKNSIGSVMGIAGFFGATGGAISATVIGTLLEITGSYVIVFAMASSAYIFAWLIIKVIIPEIKPIKLNSQS